MAERYDHMIPLPPEDHQSVRRLAAIVGRKARAVHLAIDWAIGAAPSPDPSLRSGPQLHVVLPTNYRASYTPSALGQYLHAGLRYYWGRYTGPVPDGPDIQYWQVDIPEDHVLAVQRRAFRDGRDVDMSYADVYRSAVSALLAEVPPSETRMTTIYVPTDTSLRSLYSRLNERTRPYGWGTDDLIEKRLVEIIQRWGP